MRTVHIMIAYIVAMAIAIPTTVFIIRKKKAKTELKREFTDTLKTKP